MGKADLHAHTCQTPWGDGNQTVEELLDYVEHHTDLDIFAVTDHDSTDATRHFWELHCQANYRFQYLPGVEVTNIGGHLLCYFPQGEIFDIPSLRPFWWTVRYAQERGAICIPAHPVYPPWLVPTITKGLDEGLTLDGIEAINAGISVKAQLRLDSIVESLQGRLPVVGNSDAHDQVAIGAAYTEFPGRTVDDFIQALRNGQTEPVFVDRPRIHRSARMFTTRRSMTRPGWVQNIWREFRG